MCDDNTKGLTRMQFLVDIVAIFVKIIKSIGFNVLMLTVGFILGFETLHIISHIAWVNNQNYQCVETLEKHLEEQRMLDDKIDKEIRDLKLRIIHQKKHEK